jgi:hypothetical protein
MLAGVAGLGVLGSGWLLVLRLRRRRGPVSPPLEGIPQLGTATGWTAPVAVPAAGPVTDETPFDEARYDEARYDEARYDEAPFDEAPFDEALLARQGTIPRAQDVLPLQRRITRLLGRRRDPVGTPARPNASLRVPWQAGLFDRGFDDDLYDDDLYDGQRDDDPGDDVGPVPWI